MNSFCKDADSTQAPHVGFDVDRINPLFVDIHFENLGQLVGAGIENVFLKIVLGNNASIIP